MNKLELVVLAIMLIATLSALGWAVWKAYQMQVDRALDEVIRKSLERKSVYYPKGLGVSGYSSYYVRKKQSKF